MRDHSATYHPEVTRRELLDAAYEEIWRSGFRSASLDKILTQTGVTKGALYHHFGNKLELGYAVVDEVLGKKVKEQWIEPLLAADDPIDALQHLGKEMYAFADEKVVFQGCPLNNLVQEMSGIDDGFRQRLHRVQMLWCDGVSAALREGQDRGLVRENIQPDRAAYFIVAVLEGSVGLVKGAQDLACHEPCLEGLHYYLEALRPRRGFRR